jgi:dTDP-6-deoxy-L-talose 4-dehydrogenase (NAD+)
MISAGLGSLTVTGTCLEYGLQSGALREDMSTAPVTAYGRAKDELRRHLEALQRSRAFNLTWARLFYIRGEGQAQSSLLPQLEGAIARGDAAFDMSGGEQLRDYLPVEEAAGYLVDLALNGRDNGVVNVCSGRPISVRELVESVVAKHGSPIELNLGHFPYPDYEPMRFWGDRTKLDRLLDSTDETI